MKRRLAFPINPPHATAGLVFVWVDAGNFCAPPEFNSHGKETCKPFGAGTIMIRNLIEGSYRNTFVHPSSAIADVMLFCRVWRELDGATRHSNSLC
ncbi:hypothetical protein BJ741DRAFT_74732 [Chytriomyces cf. hyalinus JEL632]|nr:hypothetical protein BJ741DRAFT_74732 [Chytriomyces cf. hyalinus JEL632]